MNIRSTFKRYKPGILSLFIFVSLILFFCNGIKGEGKKQHGLSSVTINKYEPALAVRASACVTCHAEFHSNIITDFGYGSSYFFGNPGEVKKPGRYNIPAAVFSIND